MKNKYCIFCLAVLLVLSGIAAAHPGLESDLEDQIAVEVTVYNNNLGLIKDTRKVILPVGQGELLFTQSSSTPFRAFGYF